MWKTSHLHTEEYVAYATEDLGDTSPAPLDIQLWCVELTRATPCFSVAWVRELNLLHFVLGFTANQFVVFHSESFRDAIIIICRTQLIKDDEDSYCN